MTERETKVERMHRQVDEVVDRIQWEDTDIVARQYGEYLGNHVDLFYRELTRAEFEKTKRHTQRCYGMNLYKQVLKIMMICYDAKGRKFVPGMEKRFMHPECKMLLPEEQMTIKRLWND